MHRLDAALTIEPLDKAKLAGLERHAVVSGDAFADADQRGRNLREIEPEHVREVVHHRRVQLFAGCDHQRLA
jgi:hypothetical protein